MKNLTKILYISIIILTLVGLVEFILAIWIPSIFTKPSFGSGTSSLEGIYSKIFATELIIWIFLLIILVIINSIKDKK